MSVESRPINYIEKFLYDLNTFLCISVVCKDKEQYDRFYKYIQDNLQHRKHSFIELIDKDNNKQIQLQYNPQQNKSIVKIHSNIQSPVPTLEIPFKFKVSDFTVLEQIHLLPQANQIILQLHHGIADGRFYVQFLDQFDKNIPSQKGLFMDPVQILSKAFKVPSIDEINKYPENEYDFPLLPPRIGCNAIEVTCDEQQYQNMSKRLTQKQQIIISLITMRVLQQCNLLSFNQINQLLHKQEGINCLSQTVVDLRQFCTQIQDTVNYGAGISFYDTIFNIKHDLTVKQFTEINTQLLDDLKQQKQYLQYINGVKPYKNFKLLCCPGTSSIGRIQVPFSSFGIIQHDYSRQRDGEWFLVSHTVNGVMRILLQYTEAYEGIQLDIEKWLSILISNMTDTETIGNLYTLLQ